MTLARTIKRRDKRKRAKARPKRPGNTFITPDWLVREHLADIQDQLAVARLMLKHS